MLTFTSAQVEMMSRHALQGYPEECCGLLLGRQKVVWEVYPTANAWTAEFSAQMQGLVPLQATQSRRNRFAIAPQELLTAQKYARTQQLDIIGIFHSHPDYPAVPSEYDRAIAWEIYAYVILSVTHQAVTSLKSWVLDGDRQFQEESIQII